MAKKTEPTAPDVVEAIDDAERALAERAIQDCLGCGEVEAKARVTKNVQLAKEIAALEKTGDRGRVVQLLYS